MAASGESRKADIAKAPIRTIRARLTLRGFKDHDRADIDRYAGTSSRCAQKLLVSEAVRNGWPICTLDISKAFLQGVTYEELHALTGEPMREVNLYLPASNIPLLRQIPGFKNFDPQAEVLHCDKPGTGLVDAPRAFSIKLRGVTEQKCGVKSSIVDPELCMCHEETERLNRGERRKLKNLLAVLTKHVDDLKMTGTATKMQHVLQELQKVFGELKVEWHVFTNCGVRHVHDVRTKEVTLDQIQFASSLHAIAHPQLTGGKAEDESGPELHQLFMSLLGAVAYLSLTRVDILVFISALQRHMAKSKLEHVWKLNKLLRWVQMHPCKLAYKLFAGHPESRKAEGVAQEVAQGTHL